MSYLELTDLSAAQAARVISELGPREITCPALEEVMAPRAPIAFRAERDELVVVDADQSARRYNIRVEVECDDDEPAVRLREAARK